MRPVFARAPIEGSLHMFCRNCGSKVEDGTRFCPVCGEPVADEYEPPAESQGGFQSAPAAEAQPTTPAPAKAKRSKRPLMIAADGTIYAVPADKLDIKLGEKTAEKKTVDAGDVALEPVEAAEVTDDQIAAAKKYAEEDEGAKKAGFNIDADALATAATKRRDDAVAAKQAEEEARRQAEEEARKAEEARRARTFETDYFTMVLPDWFPMDWLEFETTSDTLTANDVTAQDVASKANFTVYATDGSPHGAETAFSKTIGKTSSGKTVVAVRRTLLGICPGWIPPAWDQL